MPLPISHFSSKRRCASGTPASRPAHLLWFREPRRVAALWGQRRAPAGGGFVDVDSDSRTLGGKWLGMVRDGQGISGWRKKIWKCQEYLRLQSRCLRCATILFRAAGLNALQTQMPPHMTRILRRCEDMSYIKWTWMNRYWINNDK